MNISIIIVALLTIILITMVGLYFVWIVDSIRIKVPFVNTRRRAIPKIVEEFDLKDNDVLYDLGCGSAHVLKAAVKANKNIKAVGYELSNIPYWIARLNVMDFDNVTIKRESLLGADIENATKIFCYLGTNMMKELEPIVMKKCKKGTKIYSADFIFPNIKPIKEVELSNKNRLSKKLYIYEV